MNKFRNYLEETWDELKNKVSWPTWPELQGSSLVVLVSAFIIALVIYGMDLASSNVMKLVYKAFY